ncbi:unnamed protein product [Meganyctiphanes norvegica]|uniref:DUF885 domain-containing protein n=1 Tax=Meganyctiphanes norvegica TaxID=48144 RepID=A0AAV2RJQ8_MEGNR
MEDFQRRENEIGEFLTMAEQLPIAPYGEDNLNIQILTGELKEFLQNSKYIKFYTPVTFKEGPHITFKMLVQDYISYNTYQDYINLLSMYKKLPVQVEECIGLMKNNIASGFMPSNYSIVDVVKQLEKIDLPFKETFLYKPFTKFPDTVLGTQRRDWLKYAKELIENKVLPAYRKLKVFIMEEYLPNCRAEIGVSSLPEGREFYQACLNFHTSTNLTANDIHDIGHNEVLRIEAEAMETASEIGLGGKSITEISAALRADPSQKYSSTEEVQKAFEDAAHKDIFPLLSKYFHHMPPPNVRVKAIDDPSAGAMYGAPSGNKPGIFYFNGPLATDIFKKYGIMALTLHETAPGHHLHATYMRQNFPDMPDFRKKVDHSRYSRIPAIFALNTAFNEGWGLYSEYLGNEFGLYNDPYSKLGRYSLELLRASRLVVDTGIHAFGWSRDRAYQYLKDNTFEPEAWLQSETNRYITWPGQATAYKIGEIKIKEMRKKAEHSLGNKFNIKDFHDTVLRCFGPLQYVQKCIDDFIVENCC